MFFLVFQWENGWRKWRFFHRGFSEEERGFWRLILGEFWLVFMGFWGYFQAKKGKNEEGYRGCVWGAEMVGFGCPLRG